MHLLHYGFVAWMNEGLFYTLKKKLPSFDFIDEVGFKYFTQWAYISQTLTLRWD